MLILFPPIWYHKQYHAPDQYQYLQDRHIPCSLGYRSYKMLLYLICDIFHHFTILLNLCHLLVFLLSDLFLQISCHKPYLSDLFHHIIIWYFLYHFGNSFLLISNLLYHQLIILHMISHQSTSNEISKPNEWLHSWSRRKQRKTTKNGNKQWWWWNDAVVMG